MIAPPATLVLQTSAVVQAIQGTLDNTVERYLATVALGLSFLVVVWIIFLGGPTLKRRYGDEVVDIARTLTIMVVALAAAAVFVVIWKVEGTVRSALTTLQPENPDEMAVLLFVSFIVLLGTYVLTRVSKRTVRRWSETGRISPHQRELAHHAIQLVLFAVAIVFIFALFGQNPRDLFLGAGVLGVVIGFAARKTLSGVLSGFVILFGRPFEAGDWIAVGDREGIVTEITLFNTQVRTFNEEHVLVPNDRVTGREVINYSKTDRLRVVTEIGVDYDDDIDVAATIAKEAIEGCDAVADTPGPDVVLDSFGDSSVVLQLRYWIDKPTIQRKLSAQNAVIDAVKKAFESEDIKIPYPQRELMGREEAEGLRVAAEDADRVSVEDEVERAVRRVRADSTSIEEPVEERYRDDDKVEGEPEAARGDGDDVPDSEADGDVDGEDAEGSDPEGARDDDATGDESESDREEDDVDPEGEDDEDVTESESAEPASPRDGAAPDEGADVEATETDDSGTGR